MAEEESLQSFPALPKDFRDAAALVQSQFNEAVQALDRRTNALASEQRRRKIIAAVLKVVSVLSGLVIATGFVNQSVGQILGGIIPGIAALERVFANLSRLLAVTAAKNAYDRIRRSIVARHNNEIVEVVKIRDREPEKAADKLIGFVGKLRNLLAAKEADIEGKLAQNDYDNLGRLNLDDDSGTSAAP
jgi:hypothetical protein